MRDYLFLPLAFAAAPAFAQDAPPADATIATPPDAAIDIGGEPVPEGDEILVIATRLRGSVDAPQPPVVTLDEADIESYGASSLSDLIEAISPQTGSGRGRGDGRPVFLVNGQRISSFREIRDFPPEAIRRVEVLPEEVAQRFGYPPNQRVVNFILKDQFASRTIDGEYNVPTSGGFADSELQGSLLRIDGPRRFNLTAKLNDTSLLTEAERGLIQQPGSLPTVAGDPDPARFRSLIDDSRSMSLNGTFSTALGKENGGLLSLNGAISRSDSRSLFGLDSVLLTGPDGTSQRRTLDGALVARSRSTTVEGGVTVNKPLGSWFMTATANASHSDTRSDTENNADTSGLVAAALAGTLPLSGALPVLADAGFERARTRDTSLDTLITIAGRPFRMPAGDASLTVRGGFDYTRSRNTGGRGDDVTLDRGDASAGFNLALPLTSRRDNVLGAIGDVGLNLSAGINHLSDFGTLTDWSVGLTWKPTDRLALQASYIVNQAAPSLNQLGNPQQSAFNVSVYDFTLGEPALVTIVNGGNPDLVKEKQRDLKVSANWELPFIENSNLLVEYFRNRSTDVTQGFPLLTPAVEAAFPGRVLRDPATGRIIEIRRFPITFSEVAGSRLRWGFNVSGTVGKPDPNARAGRGGGGGGGRFGRGGGRRGGGMGRGGGGFGGGEGGGGGFGGRGGGNGQGRWNLSAFHTVRFTETATIAPGVPTLDLLGGDALSAGGVPRHQIELEGGVFHKGLGLRINGTWRAPATVRTTSAAGSSQLRFGSTTVVNLRTFLNFDQKPGIVKDVPFLKGSRLSLTIDNLFASRQKVTDQAGVVPLSYQPAYRDPRGRVIGIDFRKMF